MTPEAFHLEVPASMQSQVAHLIEATPGRSWAVMDDWRRPLFSPFIFADSAVRETFHLINDVANATEVERLPFDASSPVKIMDGPPRDEGLFGETTGRRLAAIGW